MSIQDTLSEAYDNAIEVFIANGINTDIVDEAYNTANSWSNSASAAWDATEETLNVDDASTEYGAIRCTTFWKELQRLYSETYQVSDKVSAYLDSAVFGASMDAANAYDQRIQNTQIEEALDDTIKDIKDKFKPMPLLIGGAVLVWLLSQ